MKTFEKVFITILTIALCILLFVGVSFTIKRDEKRAEFNIAKYEVTNFRSNMKQFELIAESLLDKYDDMEALVKSNDRELGFFYAQQNESGFWSFAAVCPSGAVYFDESFEMSQQEKDAYQTVYSCLETKSSNHMGPCILVFSDRIAFSPSFEPQARYSIIYTVDGERPERIYDEEDWYHSVYPMYCEQLAPNWYQALLKAGN